MSIAKIMLSILVILFGAFLFVYGEYDDSPGGQLLGLLIAIAGVWGVVKSKRENSIKKYIAYLKDNPQGLWFKARWYGWGWVPVRWQGWVVVLVFVAILLLNGIYLASKVPSGEPSTQDLILFFGVMIVSIISLFWVCYRKGEWPHWNWGPPKKKE